MQRDRPIGMPQRALCASSAGPIGYAPANPPRMAEEQEAEYERAQEALSGLISGRQRKDSGMWAHAFEMMASYLEVRVGALRAAPPGRPAPPPQLGVACRVLPD